MAIRLEAIPSRLDAIASRLEAMAIRLEAIPSRLDAIASRLEAMAIRLEAIASRLEVIRIHLEDAWQRLGGTQLCLRGLTTGHDHVAPAARSSAEQVMAEVQPTHFSLDAWSAVWSRADVGGERGDDQMSAKYC